MADSPNPSPTHPLRSRRVLLALFAACAVVLGSWLGLNLLLNTPIAPWLINRKPDRWSVHWQRAWMPWPAKVHVRGFTFRQRTRTNGLVVRADRASARIRLRAFRDRTFRAEDLVGAGLSVAIDPDGGHGQPRPDVGSAPPGFKIELLGIVVDDMREFQIGEWALTEGAASVSGSFEKQVRGDLVVRDAEIVWQGVHLRTGETVGRGSADLELRADIAPFDPRVDKGRDMLRHFTADLVFQGTASTLRPLEVFFSRAKWVEGIDGAGEVSAQLALVDGLLQPESRIDVAAEELQIDFLGFQGRGAGQVQGRIEDGGEGRDARLGLTFSEFSLGRRGTENPLLNGTGLQLSAALEDIRPDNPLQGLKVSLDLPETKAPDLAPLNNILPRSLGLTLAGGSAVFEAHLKADDSSEQAEGTFRLVAGDLTGNLRDLDFELDLELSSRLSGSDWEDFEIRLAGTELALTDGTFRHPGMKLAPDWWMRLSIPAGLASLKDPSESIAEVDLAMRDTVPLVALFADYKSWAQRIDGLLKVRDIEGRAVVRVAQDHLTLRNLLLTGERLEAEGELALEEEEMAALFRARYRFVPIALERSAGKQEWKVIKPLQWFRERRQSEWIDKRGTLSVPPEG